MNWFIKLLGYKQCEGCYKWTRRQWQNMYVCDLCKTLSEYYYNDY